MKGKPQIVNDTRLYSQGRNSRLLFIVDYFVYNESLFSPKFTYRYIIQSYRTIFCLITYQMTTGMSLYFWFHGIVLCRRLSCVVCYSISCISWWFWSLNGKRLQTVLGHCSFMPCWWKLMPWKRISSDVNGNLWNIWSGIIPVLSHLL